MCRYKESPDEDAMLHRYWKMRKGTLIEEFRLVNSGGGSRHRCADGIILPNVRQVYLQKKSRKRWHYLKDAVTRDDQQKLRKQLRNEEVIVVQVKPARLGMCLMGQATFSRFLIDNEEFEPRSVKSIAICGESDPVLETMLKTYGVKVWVDGSLLQSGVRPTSQESERYAGLNRVLVQRYWKRHWNQRGTIIYDFPIRRPYTAHALIFPNLKNHDFCDKRELDFESLAETEKQQVRRLVSRGLKALMMTTRKKDDFPGMCTMGHALFAPKLLELDYPKANIQSVIACTQPDNALKKLLNLEHFKHVEMVSVSKLNFRKHEVVIR